MGKGVATNMASELYVASILWRLGYKVTLTLGHTKEIDLFAEKNGKIITIDVKSVRTGPFLLQKKPEILNKKNHFFVFVRYGRHFSDISKNPVCYVVPATELSKVIKDAAGMERIWEGKLSELEKNFKERWDLLEKV